MYLFVAPQFVILFVGQLERDLSGFLLHHHGENVLVLERPGAPARRVNSIKASSVVKRAFRGSGVRMRSFSQKTTHHAPLPELKDIRTRCLLG
jgi:hypothetical protein